MSGKKLVPASGFKNDMFFRNRSASLSSTAPVKEYHYNEVVQNKSNVLSRSVSYAFFQTKKKGGRVYETTCVKVSNILSSRNRNRETTPKKPTASNAESDETREKSRLVLVKFFFKFLSLPLLLAYFYFRITSQCETLWDLHKVNARLDSLVLGQDDVLNNLKYTLASFDIYKEPLVFLFTGDTGVGKTFVANIIQQNFPWSSNVKVIYGINGYEVPYLSSCGMNLVIIDNFALRRVKETMKMILSITQEAQTSQKKVLVIVIFNTKTDEAPQQLVDIFNQAQISPILFPFRILNREAVTECFKSELTRLNIKHTESNLEALIEMKMSDSSISVGYTGCKDVQRRIHDFFGHQI